MLLGIEIGGTKLQLALGLGDGSLVGLERARVAPNHGADGIRQQIIALIPRLLDRVGITRGDLRAIGVGFGGPVDAERGIAIKSHQISGWDNFPLAEWCRAQVGCPTVVHNDADTAGLAEACFGAGRGYSPIFYITIGSGIGGGLVINQQVFRGSGAGAAEIGHVTWPEPLLSLEPCSTGHFADVQPITVESYSSGWGIERRARNLIRCRDTLSADVRLHAEAILTSVAGDLDQLRVEHLAHAAQSSNPLAKRIFHSSWRVLGWAIAQVIALVCPARVIVGGGVSLLGDELLFDPLRRAVSSYVFAPFANAFEIVPAAMGEPVVLHGALRLARDVAASLESPPELN